MIAWAGLERMALGMPALAAGNIALPADGMMSLTGILAIAGEATAGLALGLATQIGFAAAIAAVANQGKAK